jgi:hypothetical protein
LVCRAIVDCDYGTDLAAHLSDPVGLAYRRMGCIDRDINGLVVSDHLPTVLRQDPKDRYDRSLSSETGIVRVIFLGFVFLGAMSELQ